MHNREHIVILRPGKKGIVLHTMFYANEVRKADEFNADLNLVNDRELKLAEMLVETLAADFDPTKYSDTYREHLMGLIEAKKQGQEVMATPEPQTAKVIDILDALKASLASAKKPAAAAETSARAEAAPAKKAPRKRATG
jgi:DNA end-binding protein Ku